MKAIFFTIIIALPGALLGFDSKSPTYTPSSENIHNITLHPAIAKHATRKYYARINRDQDITEKAPITNKDDSALLIKKIMSAPAQKFTKLFNGKDLTGWHSFLKAYGVNADPDKNFRIEDSTIHVIGKDLGYIITDKAYKNYHLKVDFKWGEKKWPPRQNNKRDAGICYNIPTSEPDSIWPKSIECQIQEGDVGDFWLLSYSTIEVDGKRNVPANHTQIIKKADNEKPTGQWNTVEVISYNGRCIHIVNGVIVNQGKNATVKDGKVLLQSEYSEVYYKNVMIREL